MNGIEQLVIGTMLGVGGIVAQHLPEDLKSESVECLALNMYHEARGQGTAGELAVTTVVMNRVNDPRFPNTICGVIKQGQTRPSWKGTGELIPVRNKCQFSWWCDGKSDKPRDKNTYEKMKDFAKTLLSNKLLFLDITDGATHYHADYVNPSWAKTKTKTVEIQDHIFYRWEK